MYHTLSREHLRMSTDAVLCGHSALDDTEKLKICLAVTHYLKECLDGELMTRCHEIDKHTPSREVNGVLKKTFFIFNNKNYF